MFLSIPNCDFNTYWVPCTWFIHVLQDTKAENPNLDPIGVKLIMEVHTQGDFRGKLRSALYPLHDCELMLLVFQQFNEFRAKCGLLWSYDWISIPLVYTQVPDQEKGCNSPFFSRSILTESKLVAGCNAGDILVFCCRHRWTSVHRRSAREKDANESRRLCTSIYNTTIFFLHGLVEGKRGNNVYKIKYVYQIGEWVNFPNVLCAQGGIFTEIGITIIKSMSQFSHCFTVLSPSIFVLQSLKNLKLKPYL